MSRDLQIIQESPAVCREECYRTVYTVPVAVLRLHLTPFSYKATKARTDLQGQ